MLLTHSTSYKSRNIYLILLAICFITYIAGILMEERGIQVRMFGLDKIALVALGRAGMYLAPKTGFPDMLDPAIANRRR